MKKVLSRGFLILVASSFTLWSCVSPSNTAQQESFTLSVAPLEHGTLVVSSPAFSKDQILVGGEQLSVPAQAALAIKAQGSVGYEFSSWTGLESKTASVFLLADKDLSLGAQFAEKQYTLTLDKALNGSYTINPPVESGKQYPANTVFTLTAKPAENYSLDSVYYAVQGPWWTDNFEEMTPEFSFTLKGDYHVGASFVRTEDLEGFSVIQDIVYAKPGVKALKYDIYKPDTAKDLPLLVIIHGGGWSSNDEDIMRGLAREFVRTGKYVVASLDYRWIGNLDGDAVPNTMDMLINDVFGGLAHIQEHAKDYGANPSRIAITGDSAGGHLCASAIDLASKIGDQGFGKKPGVYEFLPSYLPKGKTAQAVKESLTKAIKVAAPSYGVFSSNALGAFLTDFSPEAKAAVAPMDNIPQISERAVPQFLLRGTTDFLIQDEMVQGYTDALKAAGQTAVYVQVEGANHAFFDWKPDETTKATFALYGVPYAKQMLEFIDSYL